jgi:hypothetical protein
MKTYLAFLIIGLILIAGCAQTPVQTPNPVVPSQPAINTTNTTQNQTVGPAGPDCAEYCGAMQPCAGIKNVSGKYPDCACGCVQPPPANPPPVNDTNLSEFPAPTPIDMTVSEMLELGMKRIKSEFYSKSSGTFVEKSYTWARVPVTSDMSEISLDSIPSSEVKFDDQSDKSIVASGFVVFTGEDNSAEANGLAIFKDKRTILDSMTGFSVDYFPPTIDKKLRDCTVYARDYYTTTNGDWFVAYSYNCLDTLDK